MSGKCPTQYINDIAEYLQNVRAGEGRMLTFSEEMCWSGCPEVAAPMNCAEQSYQPT
jgi:hypothetical protein